jgi:type VI secretion system protein ImpA
MAVASAMSNVFDLQTLRQPIAGSLPCGPALDPSELLSLDSYRVFGQLTPLDAPLEGAEHGRQGETGRTPKPSGSPEWIEIRDRACGALARSKDLRVLALAGAALLSARSKDLRVLALAGAALLRTDGPARFCQTIILAHDWLAGFWDTVHPIAVEDSIERQSALSAFNDHAAVVDGLRRAPLVDSRQHGRFSLRDIDAASQTAPVDAAFDEVALADLQEFLQAVQEALKALSRIESRILESDPQPALSTDGVAGQLSKMERVLRAQLIRRPEGGIENAATTTPRSEGVTAGEVGVIRSRQDAIRALEAVATFFRDTEPSSPVPLLLDRAKRLVSKNFLEVLADLAPGALGEARTASGVRDE